VAQDGAGRPWVTLQSIASIPLKTPFSSGYKLARMVTPVQQKTAGRWSRGDVARVHLEVEAQADMTWVVVDDPIPAGSTVLGRGLGGDSTLLAQGEKKQGTVWPAFEERTFEGFRAYYRYVPKGRFIVEYTVRLNNPGTFHLPATHVEAMYAPEMLGEYPNEDWKVQP
jgi:alpha-2-macroglobulin